MREEDKLPVQNKVTSKAILCYTPSPIDWHNSFIILYLNELNNIGSVKVMIASFVNYI